MWWGIFPRLPFAGVSTAIQGCWGSDLLYLPHTCWVPPIKGGFTKHHGMMYYSSEHVENNMSWPNIFWEGTATLDMGVASFQKAATDALTTLLCLDFASTQTFSKVSSLLNTFQHCWKTKNKIKSKVKNQTLAGLNSSVTIRIPQWLWQFLAERRWNSSCVSSHCSVDLKLKSTG